MSLGSTTGFTPYLLRHFCTVRSEICTDCMNLILPRSIIQKLNKPLDLYLIAIKSLCKDATHCNLFILKDCTDGFHVTPFVQSSAVFDMFLYENTSLYVGLSITMHRVHFVMLSRYHVTMNHGSNSLSFQKAWCTNSCINLCTNFAFATFLAI